MDFVSVKVQKTRVCFLFVKGHKRGTSYSVHDDDDDDDYNANDFDARRRRRELIDANATAHDVVALAHLVSSAWEEGSRHHQNHLLVLGDHYFFSDVLEKKEALRRGKEERDANGLTPMQVYALLGMNGRETFDAFFEGAFSNQPRSSGGDGDDDDDDDDPKEEKRRLLEIERFQRHLFCIGGDSAEAWLEKNDDVGRNAMLQVHA